jgi:hypothetical protein
MRQWEEWAALGKHRYRVVEQKLQLQSRGEFTPQDATGLMDLLDELRPGRPRLVILFDTSGGLSAPAPTRKVFVARSRRGQSGIPTAVVGAGVLIRTLFGLTLNATRLVTGHNLQVRFFVEEAEALAWLNKVQDSLAPAPS